MRTLQCAAPAYYRELHLAFKKGLQSGTLFVDPVDNDVWALMPAEKTLTRNLCKGATSRGCYPHFKFAKLHLANLSKGTIWRIQGMKDDGTTALRKGFPVQLVEYTDKTTGYSRKSLDTVLDPEGKCVETDGYFMHGPGPHKRPYHTFSVHQLMHIALACATVSEGVDRIFTTFSKAHPYLSADGEVHVHENPCTDIDHFLRKDINSIFFIVPLQHSLNTGFGKVRLDQKLCYLGDQAFKHRPYF